jgi:hypothetical protein
MSARGRFEEVKKAESVSTMIHIARRVLKEELQAHCFTLRSSNSRMAHLYMSKQMDAKGMLTTEQYEWHVPSICTYNGNPLVCVVDGHGSVRLMRGSIGRG